MFEHLKIKNCDEFLKAYQAFQEVTDKLNKLLKEGKDDPFERLRHARLASKVDQLWLRFPRAEKDPLIDILILKKMMPDAVRRALNVVGGEVDKLT